MATGPDGSLTLHFRGVLTTRNVAELWQVALDKVKLSRSRRITLDLSLVSNLDGAGLGLLAAVRRKASSTGAEVVFQGLEGDLGSLVQLSALSDPEAAILAPQKATPWIPTLGLRLQGFLEETRDLVTFTGELLSAMAWAARHPHLIRFREMFLAAEKAGVNALPIIVLLGLLIGMAIAFLAASVLHSFGAVSMIPMIVSIGMVREFAPLMTAVFLAGRSGSFYAAEIGTMKITEELDALETLGLDKMKFLVVPRLLALVITAPMLSLFFIFSSFLGGYGVCKLFGIGLPFYLSEIRENVDQVDLAGSLAKSVVFAVLVASIGCLRGMQTGSGPGAVGVSTTRSLVTGVATIVLADGILGAVYYFLGI